jgi:hypothetical protein
MDQISVAGLCIPLSAIIKSITKDIREYLQDHASEDLGSMCAELHAVRGILTTLSEEDVGPDKNVPDQIDTRSS